MPVHPLEKILHPRSVAVVGTSGSGRGGGFVTPLQELGFRGNIYPVNPKHTELFGLKVYASVGDIPGPVDFVISAVPASQVLAMLDDCAEKGVKGVHLFTARFSETGRQDAAELEQEILKRARQAGIRLIGPNCLGVYYPAEGLSFEDEFPKESGHVGLASQSGGAAGDIIQRAAQAGMRFSKGISYGNALDFNECDYLEYFAQDPETSIILMYIEGPRDGKRFFESLQRTTTTKPVIIVKGGRGQSGTRATASHTGSLAGSRQVWNTMVNQAGAIPADNLEELVDYGAAFYFLPALTGRRVGIAGGGGGTSVLAADECEEAGLDVIPLPTDIREELKTSGSPIWDWISNPADMSIRVDRNWPVGEMLEMMARNDNFDLLITFMHGHIHRGQRNQSATEFLKDYHLSALQNKPTLVVMEGQRQGSAGVDEQAWFWEMLEEVKAKLTGDGIPIYPNIGRAARSVVKVIDYYRGKESL
jgi:acyl-CoA synthetase (NDP forming)